MNSETENCSGDIRSITKVLQSIGEGNLNGQAGQLSPIVLKDGEGSRLIRFSQNGGDPWYFRESSGGRDRRCWIISTKLPGVSCFYLFENNSHFDVITAGIGTITLQGDADSLRPQSLDQVIGALGYDPTVVNELVRANCEGEDVVFVKDKLGNGITLYKRNMWILARNGKKVLRFKKVFCVDVIKKINSQLERPWI